MTLGITIEWEQVVLMDGPVDTYLVRLIEPRATGKFATLLRGRKDGLWSVVWYPNCDSGKVKTFGVASKEEGIARIEKWARLHGSSLPAQQYLGRSAVSNYETRQL